MTTRRLKELFEAYCFWSSLPRHYNALTDAEKEKLGITDAETLMLLEIKTKKQFAEKFKVSMSTLNSWERSEEFASKVKANWKGWAQRLTPNVVGVLYKKILQEGDPGRIKLWKEWIEQDQDKVVLAIDEGIAKILKHMQEDGENNGDNVSEHKDSGEREAG